jgi:hypothetical protein
MVGNLMLPKKWRESVLIITFTHTISIIKEKPRKILSVHPIDI